MSTQSSKNNSVRLVIYGEPASKANSRIVRVIRGRVLNIKSQKAQGYKAAFLKQCPVIDPMLTGDLSVTIKIYYASRRPDLDPSLILDLMQERIYLNDRQVKEQHLYWGLDPATPRAEIVVEQRAEGTLPGKARPAKGRGKARDAG
jgi:Holliday junction resolvase RusA-like endonuclease